jgi:hypothetical protein
MGSVPCASVCVAEILRPTVARHPRSLQHNDGSGRDRVLVVGSVDNLLRPRLVGQDTKMHELLIFFSALGGLMLFGATGFILGPILAALFVTAWEMFGAAFRTELAEPGSAAAGPKVSSASLTSEHCCRERVGQPARFTCSGEPTHP